MRQRIGSLAPYLYNLYDLYMDHIFVQYCMVIPLSSNMDLLLVNIKMGKFVKIPVLMYIFYMCSPHCHGYSISKQPVFTTDFVLNFGKYVKDPWLICVSNMCSTC